MSIIFLGLKTLFSSPFYYNKTLKPAKDKYIASQEMKDLSLRRDMKLTKEHINKIRITFMSSEKQKIMDRENNHEFFLFYFQYLCIVVA